MPLVARLLPAAEWPEKLKGTDLEDTPLDPRYTRIFVVELDDHVVATVAAFNSVHVEGLWEAETHRGNPGVSRALLGALVTELVASEVGEVLAQASSPEMEDLFATLGGKELPGSGWVIPVKGVQTWVA